MNVRELIAILSDLPPDLPVVHCTGTMNDREPVDGCLRGKVGDRMWDGNHWTDDGVWVELL